MNKSDVEHRGLAWMLQIKIWSEYFGRINRLGCAAPLFVCTLIIFIIDTIRSLRSRFWGISRIVTQEAALVVNLRTLHPQPFSARQTVCMPSYRCCVKRDPSTLIVDPRNFPVAQNGKWRILKTLYITRVIVAMSSFAYRVTITHVSAASEHFFVLANPEVGSGLSIQGCWPLTHH